MIVIASECCNSSCSIGRDAGILTRQFVQGYFVCELIQLILNCVVKYLIDEVFLVGIDEVP